MNKKILIIIAIIILLIIAGGSFYGGMLYGQNQRRNAAFQANGGVSIRGNRQQGGGFTAGEIISKDDKSITIKLPSGGSKIVFYAANTEIGKFTNGTTADLTVGQTVSVTGSANQDGSVTAQSVQIRPNILNQPK